MSAKNILTLIIPEFIDNEINIISINKHNIINQTHDVNIDVYRYSYRTRTMYTCYL